MSLRELFNSWAAKAQDEYIDQQWLLSKWDILEGVQWPEEKIEAMVGTLVDGLQLGPGQLVADLGCGGGWIGRLLRSRVKNVIGLDFSLEMLFAASRIIDARKSLVAGEIGKLPFKDDCFDRALSYFVFVNFMDDIFVQQAILDIIRVVKPGGRVLIGQLPDKSASSAYDTAKNAYLDYCRKEYNITRSVQDQCQAPQKLFDRPGLEMFLKKQKINYEIRNSFNPYYFPGQPKTIPWRFDLLITK